VRDGQFVEGENLFGFGIIKGVMPDKERLLTRAYRAYRIFEDAKEEATQARKALERMARKGNPWAQNYLDALKTFASLPPN